MKRHLALLSASASLLLASLLALLAPPTAPVLAASFTPGNLVLYRVGDGAGPLAASGNPVFLDEYTPGGTLVQSLALPTTSAGANRRLIASDNSSEGLLTRSADGRYLILTGYDATPPVPQGLVNTSAVAVNRVVGRVDAAGTFNTYTALRDVADFGAFRSAVSTNGVDLWVAGANGGVRYTTLAATSSTALASVPDNVRQLQIFGGQLYASAFSGDSSVRIGTLGSGTPTTPGQTFSSLPGYPQGNNISPYGFFLADLSAGVAGMDTLYVADNLLGQLRKYTLAGSSWQLTASVEAGGVRGLIGSVGAGTVLLYATNGPQLLTFNDNTGYGGVIEGVMPQLVPAPVNSAFRGVALAPEGLPDATPTPADTSTPTGTRTATPTHTPTGTRTITPEVTPSSSATASATASATSVDATATPTDTPTDTPTTTPDEASETLVYLPLVANGRASDRVFLP